MKLIKPINYQCAAIVQPGEYLIDKWDNKQCGETSPRGLVKCEDCGKFFCLLFHWPKHWHDIEATTGSDYEGEVPF